MKKTALLITSYCVALALVFTSCQEDQKPDTNLSSSISQMLASEAELTAYANTKLTNIAERMNPFISNPDVRSIVYDEISKKYGGDEVVLIEKLVSRIKNSPLTSDSKLMSAISSIEKELEEMNALPDIRMKPHIYIPNFDIVVKDYNIYQMSSEANSANTIKRQIVVFDGQETEEPPTQSNPNPAPITKWPSYVFNRDGELIESGMLISEANTLEYEIWVMAINELENICDGSGGPCAPEGQVTNIAPTTAPDWDDAFFATMKVKDLKEAWPSGKSEVCIVRFASWEDGFNPLTRSANFSNWVGDPSWVNITKWKRSDQGKELTINWKYYNDWNPPAERNSQGTVGTHMWYVVYEHDWGVMTPKPTSTTSNRGFLIEMRYKSRQSPFSDGVIGYLQANSFSLTNDAIEFQSKVSKD